MIEWITDTIAIGSRVEALDARLVAEGRFHSILSLDGPLEPADMQLFASLRLRSYRLIDGPGNDAGLYLRAVNAVGQLVTAASPALVHCHAGRSRSPVVVAGHLSKTLRLDPAEALALVRLKREVVITAGLERLLWTL